VGFHCKRMASQTRTGTPLRKPELERREDEEDVREALEVLRTSNPAERLTSEQVMAELGITREEVDNAR